MNNLINLIETHIEETEELNDDYTKEYYSLYKNQTIIDRETLLKIKDNLLILELIIKKDIELSYLIQCLKIGIDNESALYRYNRDRRIKLKLDELLLIKNFIIKCTDED